MNAIRIGMLVVVGACDMGQPPAPPATIVLDTPPATERTIDVAPPIRVQAVDGCVRAVSGAPSTAVQSVVQLTNGKRLGTTGGVLGPTSYPLATPLAPRTNFVTASIDNDDVLVTMTDERDHPVARYRFAMPAYPAFDNSGKIVKTGWRCAMGIWELRWWDVSSEAIVAVKYSLSDMCNDAVWHVCSVAALPVPKDLPTHD